jgi:hypothetical protein
MLASLTAVLLAALAATAVLAAGASARAVGPTGHIASSALVAGAPATSVEPTALRVVYWQKGAATAAPDSTWTLRCTPPRGTLPRPAVACRRLARGGAGLFAPTPPGTACTQIYGGPQKARVVGVVGGRRVWATFTRTNGCEIARWNKLSPWLLPAGRIPS